MLYAILTVALLAAAAVYPYAPLAISWLGVSVPTALATCAGFRMMCAEDRWMLPIFKARA